MASILAKKGFSLKGHNWGQLDVRDEDKVIEFKVDGQTAFELPLGDLAQANVQPKSNEVALEFLQDDTRTDEAVLEMRFVIPNNPAVYLKQKPTGAEAAAAAAAADGPAGDGAEGVEEDSVAVRFHRDVATKADIMDAAGEALVTLDDVSFPMPRGRYDVELHPTLIKLHGKSYNYTILYKNISRLFVLPSQDNRHVYVVLGLDPKRPVKRGDTEYPFLTMSFDAEEELEVKLNLTPEQLRERYGDALQAEMKGFSYRVVSKLLRVLTGRPAIHPETFRTDTDAQCIKCSLKTDEGLLYPLEKYFFFLHKPTVVVRMDDVMTVEFARVSGAAAGGHVRTFDFVLHLKSGGQLQFRNLARDDYKALFKFVNDHKLTVENIESARSATTASASGAAAADQDDAYRKRLEAAADEDDSDEDDEDFNDEAGSESDPLEHDSNAEDSEDEEDGGDGAAPGHKRKASPAAESEGSASSEDEVEVQEPAPKHAAKKPAVKAAKAAAAAADDGKKKKAKKSKDPFAPKAASSAFIFFSNDMRAKIKAEHPGMSFSEVGKLLGDRWKTATPEEKKKYTEMAEADKRRYEQQKKAYEARKASAAAQE